MARSNAKPTESKNENIKAGRKKAYKEPPRINRDKQDRREAGEQQFQSLVNFTEEVPSVKLKDGVWVTGVKHVPVPYKYDPTRKRIVFNTFWNPGPDGNGRAPR